jgi:hypothetical protein
MPVEKPDLHAVLERETNHESVPNTELTHAWKKLSFVDGKKMICVCIVEANVKT